jgi:hypothetical protein
MCVVKQASKNVHDAKWMNTAHCKNARAIGLGEG